MRQGKTRSAAVPAALLLAALALLAGCEPWPAGQQGGSPPPPAQAPGAQPAPPASGTTAAEEDAVRELVVVATGDLNGWLRRDLLFPGERRGLAHLVPVLARLRAAHPDLILLDAGDGLVGAPSTTRELAAGGAPSPTVPTVPTALGAMGSLDYDAAVPGNRELALGREFVQAVAAASPFPWLAANLLDRDGALPLKPYLLLERRGLRVAVVGLTSPVVHLGADPARLEGWQVADLEAAAAEWAAAVRAGAAPDLVIGLLHSGLNGDYDRTLARGAGVALTNAAGRVADGVPGFDLIVSGHAHRLSPRYPTDAPSAHGTPVLEAGSRGNGLAVATFRLERRAGRWAVTAVERRTLLAAERPDGDWAARFEPALAVTRAWLAEPAAAWIVTEPGTRQLHRCAGALQDAALRRHLQGHPGGTGGTGGAAGEGPPFTLLPMLWRGPFPATDRPGARISRAHLFRWMPYEDSLVRAELTARQMALLLEPYVRYRRELAHSPGEVLHPGGLTPHFERGGGEAHTLTAAEIDSNPPGGPETGLAAHGAYPVWLTLHHWHGGGGLAATALLHPAQLHQRNPAILRELVFGQLRDETAPLPAACGWLSRQPPSG